MSKSFSDGYALGEQDGEKGENNLPNRAWVRSFTNIGSFLPGAENRDDEWIKGYRSGFEDKVRRLNVVQQTSGGLTMEALGNSGSLDVIGTLPKGVNSGTGNTFAHRISVARNLYEQAVRLRKFLFQTEQNFAEIFSRHEVLVGEFFNDLLTYHIRPRLQQINLLAQNVQTLDHPKIQALVEKYEQAILGKERGTTVATSFFTQVNLSSADQISGLSASIGNGNPRDYETQLAVALSIRRLFEGLLSQLDAVGRAYDGCVRDHDELMKQDFNAFIRQNAEPRLQEISDLWRLVRDRDLVGIDDVIQRLRTVSSI